MKPTTSKLSEKLAEEWCVKLLINGNERTRLRHGLSELIHGLIHDAAKNQAKYTRLKNARLGELVQAVEERMQQ